MVTTRVNTVYFDNFVEGEFTATGTSLQGKNDVIIETSLVGANSLTTATELISRTSIIEMLTIDPLIISGRVVADVNDKMVQGTFEFDGATVGGIFSSNYWKHVEFNIPDYAGVQQPVFVGFFPSSQSRYAHASETETLTGYDFSWYLSRNYLPDSDLVLLTNAHQAAITKYQLEFDNQQHWFQVGNVVVGGTTGHTGRIVEVNYGVFDDIVIENPTGIFQDDEELLVGGVVYAYADGHAVDITGTADPINPDDWIRRVLGGDDWDALYGLEPYRIASTDSVWGSTVPEIDFSFGDRQSIIDAIAEPSEYLEYILFPSWRDAGDYQQPCVYWIPGDDIDDASEGLDLPAAVTITAPDGYLVSVDVDQVGEESYNKVTVLCRLMTGSWYSKTVQSSGVDNKTERVREYRETATNLFTAADCDTRCADLYAYYNMQTITWKAVFLLRSDFRRLQKLIFSGYSTKIPDGTYRITRLEYEYANGGTTNQVTVTLVADSAYKTYMSLNRSYTNAVREVQRIVNAEIEKHPLPEIGTISSVDGAGGVMWTSEQGINKPGIDADP